MAGSSKASLAGEPEFSPLRNPDGTTEGMTYDILVRSHGGQQHSALAFIEAKARANGRALAARGPHLDVFANQLILPPCAPDLFTDPEFLWSQVDARAWSPNQHLLAGPTFWFPGTGPYHLIVRRVAAFAQERLADVHGVAVHLIAHAPSRIAHKADFHVHLPCTAQTVTSDGFGQFVRVLLDTGCQHRCKAEWDAW
jgi:hypothetical protein